MLYPLSYGRVMLVSVRVAGLYCRPPASHGREAAARPTSLFASLTDGTATKLLLILTPIHAPPLVRVQGVAFAEADAFMFE